MLSYTGIVLIILVMLPSRSDSQGPCPMQLDVALIIDQSGSILTDAGNTRVWQESILEFSAGLVHVLPIGPDTVRLGVVKFSTNARVAISLDEYKDSVSLEVAVRDLEYGGGETNIAEGLSVARHLLNDIDLGARNGVRKIAVLISDGRANLNKSGTQLEGNSTRSAGVEVFSIGVTNLTNEAEMKGIASLPTSTHYYLVSDRDVLNKTLTSILTQLCPIHEQLPNATVPTTTPLTPTASSSFTGSTSTITSTTTLKISDSTITSTRSSTSPSISTTAVTQSTTPLPTCLRRADIVLIIDESRDEVLGGYNWYNFVRSFSIGIINALPVAPYIVRIGVVTYNTVAQVDINLGQYPDAASLERAIQNLQLQSGDRNTADGLNLGRNLLFSGNSGARPGVQKVAFLITNGQPSRNRDLTRWEADLTKSAGVEIFSIGVTNQVDEIELRSIASVPTATHYYFESNYNSVTRLILMVLNGYCTPVEVPPSSSVGSTSSFTTVYNPTLQDIGFNNTDSSTAKATTSQSISATTPRTTSSTTQSTLVSSTTQTTPTTSATTTQSTSSTSATPNTPAISTSTTQMTSTTPISTTTSSAASSTANPAIPTSSTSATPSSSTTTPATTSTTPITSTGTSTLQTPTATTSTTTSAPTTGSTSTTSNTPTATTTSTSTTQSASTASTTSFIPTTSTSTTQTTPTTATTSTTTTLSSSTTQRTSAATTTPIASGLTTATSTTQSTSSRTTAQSTSTRSTSIASSTTSTSSSTTSTSSSTTSTSSPSTTTKTTQTTTPTTTVTPCPQQIDIVLILDETTSIVAAPGGYDNWNGYILGFAEGFVNVFQVDPDYVRIGVVKFSWFASVVITLDQYSDAASLIKAVKSLEINGGQTNIAAGLRVGRSLLFNASQGAREGAKKMAFLVTDGRANVDHDLTQPEVNITKAVGVEIYCIGVTSQIYEQELVSIASAPTSIHYYFVINYNMLNQVLEQLRGTICFALQLSSTTIHGRT